MNTIKTKMQGNLPENFICGLNGLAEFMGISRNTASRITKDKRLPFYQCGRKFYFDPAQVLEAMSSKNLNKS